MPHPTHFTDTLEPQAHAGRLDTPITAFENGNWRAVDDALAVERALEIHVAGPRP